MCFVLVGVGFFSLYTVCTKPNHPWSANPYDHVIGTSRTTTRIMRGAVGLLFVCLGIVGILRTLRIL
jgi:hypothetical protein